MESGGGATSRGTEDDDEGVDASTLLVRFESNARGRNLRMPSLGQSPGMNLT